MDNNLETLLLLALRPIIQLNPIQPDPIQLNPIQPERVCRFCGGDDNFCRCKNRHRVFKCRMAGEEFGRFVGSAPKIAASKVFSMLMKTKRIGPDVDETRHIDNGYIFEIRECTQGRRKKNYYYTGKRIEYEQPCEVVINHGNNRKVIRFQRRNKITKLRRDLVPEDFL